jgi:hypothetical protein
MWGGWMWGGWSSPRSAYSSPLLPLPLSVFCVCVCVCLCPSLPLSVSLWVPLPSRLFWLAVWEDGFATQCVQQPRRPRLSFPVCPFWSLCACSTQCVRRPLSTPVWLAVSAWLAGWLCLPVCLSAWEDGWAAAAAGQDEHGQVGRAGLRHTASSLPRSASVCPFVPVPACPSACLPACLPVCLFVCFVAEEATHGDIFGG